MTPDPVAVARGKYFCYRFSYRTQDASLHTHLYARHFHRTVIHTLQELPKLHPPRPYTFPPPSAHREESDSAVGYFLLPRTLSENITRLLRGRRIVSPAVVSVVFIFGSASDRVTELAGSLRGASSWPSVCVVAAPSVITFGDAL
jgi:hypothetical protein